MPKILKPYTIIPPDLYIQRDADRQIKNIITDMGRPGYVLVSRQMGKTNLLINAKRRLETPDDVFVYIDLSSHFDNAKCCFENIIDTAIETNFDKLTDVGGLIQERREDLRDTPAHKQHTNELRQLLNVIQGKLVIILDEIDALTKTTYSDQIFAQIRSTYFSRVNFPEFERLTYILSGVIEPSEIIKDPKISPFNIGQKIFLNDFSKDEFELFIKKANLSISDDIIERIYYWTCGNPRMTWDLCSEVENYIKHETINITKIDQIVIDLYLTKFDKPPVDHIRELVANDREIRNSIIEIEYKKGNVISDKIKSKLYLAGVINYNETDIHIKNEIIRSALSLDWIKSLEEEDKGLVRLAIEQCDKENFAEGIKNFEKYLETNEFEEEDKSLGFYYLGYAYYRSSNFKKSLANLDKTTFDIDEEAKWYYRVLNLKGLTYFYLDEIEQSLKCFKKIIESGRKDEIYVRALLNYGSISLKSNKHNYWDDAKNIFNEIINEVGFDKDKLKESFVNELKSIAHYNLAQIEVSNKNHNEAIKNYNCAIKIGKPSTKPTLLLSLLEVTTKQEDKIDIIKQIIEVISYKKLKPIENDPEKPLNFTFDDLRHILISALLLDDNDIFMKMKPLFTLINDTSLSKGFLDLIYYSINIRKDWRSALSILQKLKANFENIEFDADEETEYITLKLIAYFTNVNTSIDNHKEYVEIFEQSRYEKIDYLDMEIFANLIFKLTEQKKYQEALKYVCLINAQKSEVSEDILINYLVIFHLELNLYIFLNDKINAIAKAKEIIQLSNDEKIKNKKSNLLGETGLDVVRQNAESILGPSQINRIPVKSEKNYGRNELIKVRYKDGTILETKFKKVEPEINQGKCVILN